LEVEAEKTNFIGKLIAGIPTTEADWDEHLLAYHRSDPGGTARSFARWRAPSGLTSYELLADVISAEVGSRQSVRILDLACGDGYLIALLISRLGDRATFVGADISAAELEGANSRLQDHDVELLERRAQSLLLAEHSIDAVVCHMAFMLMSPIEPVIKEIALVLRPAGLFAAVVNRAPAVGTAEDNDDAILSLCRRQIAGFLAREYPGMGRARIGDPRVGSRDGLRELFNPGTGFQNEVEVQDFDLMVEATPQGVADFWISTYVLGALSVQKRDQLRVELTSSLDPYQSDQGTLRMAFPMSMILARAADGDLAR
jgi:SAM-dependent methyltransferase